MKKLEYKDFEIKSIDYNQDNKEMFITGYACVFGNQDTPQAMYHSEFGVIQVSDVLVKGSAIKTISERGQRIAFCLNHEIDEPIGKIIEMYEDSYGIFIKVRISDSEPDIKTKISEGIYREFSIGFVVVKSELEKQLDETYIRKLIEIKLYEVSLVTIARNDKAIITDVKSIELIDSLIDTEKNEEKKYKLMQIKSLFENEPIKPLEEQKPKNAIDFDSINFIN